MRRNWLELSGSRHNYGSIFYLRKEIYSKLDAEWKKKLTKNNLSNYKVAMAPFGGPTAIYHNTTRATSEKSLVWIYSSDGKLLGSFEEPKQTIYMEWLENESLMIVTKTNRIHIYSIFGNLIKEKVIPFPNSDQEIKRVISYGDGVVILSKGDKALELHLFSKITSPDPQFNQLANLQTYFPVSSDEDPCMEILPFSKSYAITSIHVLLSYKENILRVSSENIVEIPLNGGAVKNIVASPNKTAVAFITNRGALRVCRADFKEGGSNGEIVVFDGDWDKYGPKDIKWVGEEAVVLYWENSKRGGRSKLLMIGPNLGYRPLEFEEPLGLCTELDGLRIINSESLQFLQKVPSSTLEIFSVGSTSNAANLFDAYQAFVAGEAKSMQLIKTIRQSNAVEECLKAALHEFDAEEQKRLLKAASFGKSFPPSVNAHHNLYVRVCNDLRVLNTVRERGIPLTAPQLEVLTINTLIDRLVNRNEHLLAYKLCKFLNIKEDGVLVHWACEKVCSNETDESILASIETKLSKHKTNISFSVIAATAFRKGKTALAMKLLEFEQLPSEQVPLLLNMDQKSLALSRALESGESDLVYLVLLYLRAKVDKSQLIALLQNENVQGKREDEIMRSALNLFVKWCIENNDKEMLELLFNKLNDVRRHATINVRRSLDLDILGDKNAINYLKDAKTLLEKGGKTMSGDEKIVSDHIKLNGFQEEMIQIINSEQEQLQENLQNRGIDGVPAYDEEELEYLLEQFKGPFIRSCSQTDTVRLCLLSFLPSLHDLAKKIKKEFKINDRRYTYIVISAYAQGGRFKELEEYSKKKSPIGYKPFAEACIRAEKDAFVQHYLRLVDDIDDKIDLHCQLQDITSAIKLALTSKRDALYHLKYIQNAAPQEKKMQVRQAIANYQES